MSENDKKNEAFGHFLNALGVIFGGGSSSEQKPERRVPRNKLGVKRCCLSPSVSGVPRRRGGR